MATGDDMSVASEIAGLRMQMEVGFTRLEGQLNLLVQSQGHFREELADLEDAVGDVEKRVKALEERSWPVGQMAVVSGVVGAVAAVSAIFIR